MTTPRTNNDPVAATVASTADQTVNSLWRENHSDGESWSKAWFTNYEGERSRLTSSGCRPVPVLENTAFNCTRMVFG